MHSRCTLLALALALSATSCVTREEVEDIKKSQEQILAQLEKIEKLASARPQGPPPPMPPQGPDPQKVYSFPVGSSPVHGPADAWVTIVEVSDFQCPFCGRALATLKEVEQNYGGDVRVVFKNNPLPFHNRAMPAAMAAECANAQKKFWPLHDKMFENQRALEDSNLEAYAKESGIDVAKFKACIADGKLKKNIEEDQTTAARLGARGTPAFFINGRFLSGAQPFPAFKAIIDEELKKAKASGVAKKAYYAQVVEARGEKSM